MFAGSFDLDAAEEVCEAELDTIGPLVDKSLLRQTVEGRFFMLETIREYAAERLAEDDDVQMLRRRHAERTLRVAEAASARRHEGFAVLQAEHAEARAALDFLAEAAEPELALRLAIAYGDFWYVRGHIREGDRRLEAAIAAAGDVPAELRVVALTRAASLARVSGEADRAERHATAALELAQALGDHVAVAGPFASSARRWPRGRTISGRSRCMKRRSRSGDRRARCRRSPTSRTSRWQPASSSRQSHIPPGPAGSPTARTPKW